MNLEGIDGKIVKPQEGFQMNFCSSSVDVVWGGGNLGGGKEQPLDSHVLTPEGFVEMRYIKVGSRVTTPFDGIANVIAVFPQGIKDVYELVLSDGRKCECGLEHLWTVYTKRPNSFRPLNGIEGSITVPTKYLIENIKKGQEFFIPNAKLVDNYYNSLHIDEIVTRIESINKVRKAECQCILIDDERHLYITDDYIVTHNSYALVLSMAEPLLTDGRFRGLISRKSLQNQKAGGGFVDKFKDIFGEYCSIKESDNPRISFDSGAFCDLTYIDDSDMKKLRERAKGWEYDLIAVDEMTEMSFECFFYIMTRNRGSSKTFTGKMRATLNPKRSHWSRTFLDWYIGHDGFIIPERNGVVRYFYINGDSVNDVVWGRSKEDVYRKCRIDIDRKLQAFGGEATYNNLIKSFVFYQGKISENKSMLGNNLDYIGSVAASGGRMAQALLEGNFNVDPDEDAQRAIKSDAARRVFLEDPATNGEMWITVDLADYGSDNLVALVWNGFHVIDKLVLTHTTPRDNALNVKTLAQDHKIAEAHIIFDGTSGRYFNDYIPDAICYISRRKSFGIYKNQAPTLKDLCYLRLTKMINAGRLTFDEEVAQSIYRHNNLNHSITIQDEFLDECSVVNFNRMPNGGRRLDTKKEMNAKLGKGRSMDLLDPCAMRMLPCVDLPYGDEINGDENGDRYDRDDGIIDATRVNVFDETLWA